MTAFAETPAVTAIASIVAIGVSVAGVSDGLVRGAETETTVGVGVGLDVELGTTGVREAKFGMIRVEPT